MLTALELNFSSHCLLLWRNVDIDDYTKIQIYLNLSFICFLNKRFKQHGTSTGKMKTQKGENIQNKVTSWKPQNLCTSAIILIYKDDIISSSQIIVLIMKHLLDKPYNNWQLKKQAPLSCFKTK
jgi:hypothetical protein